MEKSSTNINITNVYIATIDHMIPKLFNKTYFSLFYIIHFKVMPIKCYFLQRAHSLIINSPGANYLAK